MFVNLLHAEDSNIIFDMKLRWIRLYEVYQSCHMFLSGYDGIRELCFFPDNFYLIATMDRSR